MGCALLTTHFSSHPPSAKINSVGVGRRGLLPSLMRDHRAPNKPKSFALFRLFSSSGSSRGSVPQRGTTLHSPKSMRAQGLFPSDGNVVASSPELTSDVQLLVQSFSAWQKQRSYLQILGVHVPKLWLFWMAFGVAPPLCTWAIYCEIEKRFRVSLLLRESVAVGYTSLPMYLDKSLFPAPVLATTFAASLFGFFWARWRTNRRWQKFIASRFGAGYLTEAVTQANRLVVASSGRKNALAVALMTAVTISTKYYSHKANTSQEYMLLMEAHQWRYPVPSLRDLTGSPEQNALYSALPSFAASFQARKVACGLQAVAMFLALSYSPFAFLPVMAGYFAISLRAWSAFTSSPWKTRVALLVRASLEDIRWVLQQRKK